MVEALWLKNLRLTLTITSPKTRSKVFLKNSTLTKEREDLTIRTTLTLMMEQGMDTITRGTIIMTPPQTIRMTLITTSQWMSMVEHTMTITAPVRWSTLT